MCPRSGPFPGPPGAQRWSHWRRCKFGSFPGVFRLMERRTPSNSSAWQHKDANENKVPRTSWILRTLLRVTRLYRTIFFLLVRVKEKKTNTNGVSLYSTACLKVNCVSVTELKKKEKHKMYKLVLFCFFSFSRSYGILHLQPTKTILCFHGFENTKTSNLKPFFKLPKILYNLGQLTFP